MFRDYSRSIHAESEEVTRECWDVIVVGGGLAGLSGAIYLGRALRKALIIDNGKSLAQWEPHVENYLGFPNGTSGPSLLDKGREHAMRYGVPIRWDTIHAAARLNSGFKLTGERGSYSTKRILLATGLFHLAPTIPGVEECLGHSIFFCKDCDAFRVRGQRIAILGCNNETVEYALAMVAYSPCVIVSVNGQAPRWDSRHAEWLREYEIPVHAERIVRVEHDRGMISSITFESGLRVAVDCAFTTRGDVYHNELAKSLGAQTDEEGQVLVNDCLLTSVPGLYAAGCVTPANCQMIVAAGEGAIAAQAINRDLFEESLRTHSLRRFRERQLKEDVTLPEVIEQSS